MEKLNRKQRDTDKLNKRLNYISRQNTKYLDQEQEGYIVPDEGEETKKLEQEKIKDFIPNYNAENIFSLKLPKGPFNVEYSSNGRKLLLSGRNCATIMDWKSKDIISELILDQENDRIKDAKFINNDNMYALSQNESLCIYDAQGIEIHNLNQYYKPKFLENLPYHYILVSSTKNK